MPDMAHEGYAYTASTADVFKFPGVSFGIAISHIYVLVGGMHDLGNTCILVGSFGAKLHLYAGDKYTCMGGLEHFWRRGLEQLFLGSSFGQD